MGLKLAMRAFWSDPYLWIHLAGLAAVPLFVEVSLVGFALGDPFLPVWLELLLVAIAGIAPILWMQWQRPFYIFSLVTVCLKPAALTDDQRRLLTLFKSPRNRALAVLASILLVLVLWKVYALAPIATPSVEFLSTSRWLGLLVAAIAFLACNLFVQVPLSVASVMLSSESTFAQAIPYPQEQIRQGFSLLGLPLSRILPPVVPTLKSAITPQATHAAAKTTDSTATADASQPVDSLTDDVWSETAAAAPEDAMLLGDQPAVEMDAVAVDRLAGEELEVPTVAEESSPPEELAMNDRPINDPSVEAEPSSEPSSTDGDDREREET